ncbi:MAG: phosphoglucomutase/phosphomannomutase family protein [Candidatus Goldiibacteriota bacterium]
MTGIKFGTDGWRAKIGEGFTYENLSKAADAYAAYTLGKIKKPRIALGCDNRFMSENYAQFTAERLRDYGFYIYFFDKAVHTPMVSWAVKTLKLDSGIMITSSHNPAQYNGFKVKNKFGAGISTEESEKLEAFAKKKINIKVNKGSGFIETINMDKKYCDAIRKMVDIEFIKKSGIRIVLDVMYGSGAGYIENIFDGYKGLTVINNHRDPLFGGINPEPIEKNLMKLMQTVKKTKADIGIAIDGDGDRMAVIDNNGAYMTPHKTLVFHMLHHLKHRKMKFRFVKTISGTFLLDKIAAENRIKLLETPVGFKYIGEKIIDDRNTIGGEESGGVGFGYYLPERDGILGNLLVLEFLAKEKKKITGIIRELDEKYGKYMYDRVDVKFKESERNFIYKKVNKLEKNGFAAGKKIKAVNRLDGIKYILNDNEWLLFRFSGTEPLLRIYSEAPSSRRVEKNLRFGKQIIK